MSLQTVVASNRNEREWDEVIESSPHGTYFHTWKILRLIEQYSGAALYPLLVQKGDENIGCFPLFLYEKAGFRMLFSPPLRVAIPRLGPVIAGYDSLTQKKRESVLRDFTASIEDWIHEEIEPGFVSFITGDLEDSRFYLWRGYSIEPVFNYFFDITPPVAEIWARIRSTTRGNIKRAERQGLVVNERGEDALLPLIRLMSERYEAQGLTMKVPVNFFTAMYEVSNPRNMRIFTVEHQNEIVSGNIEVYYNRTALSWVGAAKAMKNANDLLTWECIRFAAENGYSKYKIMGAAGTARLHSYYAQFNPHLHISFSASRYRSMVLKILMNLGERFKIFRKFGDLL